jgi:hypothetical protein
VEREGDFAIPGRSLNVVNVDLFLTGSAIVRVFVRVSVAELEVGLAILALSKGVGLIDLGVLGKLAIGLEGTGFIGSVLENDIALVVLEVSERQEDNITLVDPDLLSHLSTNVGETLAAVKAQSLETTVSKHLNYLSVLLAILLEGELSALVIVLLGTTSAVLSTLSLVLRHVGGLCFMGLVKETGFGGGRGKLVMMLWCR